MIKRASLDKATTMAAASKAPSSFFFFFLPDSNVKVVVSDVISEVHLGVGFTHAHH